MRLTRCVRCPHAPVGPVGLSIYQKIFSFGFFIGPSWDISSYFVRSDTYHISIPIFSLLSSLHRLFRSSSQMLLSLPHPSPAYLPAKPQKTTKLPFFIPRCSLTTKPETASTSAIQRISDKLRSLGYLESNPESPNPNPNPSSAGEIFIPTPQELPKHRVGHTIDASWSTPENPVPDTGTGLARFRELWQKEREEGSRVKKEEGRVPMVAELTVPAKALKRLRKEGIRLEKRLKVGKAGITEGIVNGIHERWRRAEVVKIKCEDLCRMNMKRTHETLEVI